MNYYEILGVEKTATPEEIRKAYRQLSLKYHPDRNTDPSATEKYKDINEAYETLSDSAERNKYDMMQNMDPNDPFAGLFGGMPGVPPFFNNLGGRSGRGGGGNIRIFTSNGGGMGGMGGMGGLDGMEGLPPELSHIFSMFGGAPPGFPPMGRPTFMKPQPIHTNIQVSMETVLNGGTIPISVDRWLIEHGMKVIENISLSVEVPKGIDDKETIILAGVGNVSGPNVTGDVIVTVHVNNTTPFKRNGLDLIYNAKITLKESLCGFKMDILHINGKRYSMNNSAGKIITPGHVKTLPLLGLSNPSGTTGNLLVVFEVEFPASLTQEQTEQLKTVL
jgi:DnaJ family protein B protein 4